MRWFTPTFLGALLLGLPGVVLGNPPRLGAQRAASAGEVNPQQSAGRASSGAGARRRCPPISRRLRRRLRLQQLYDGPGLRVLHPARSWASSITARTLRRAARAYHQLYPDAAPLWVHDISRRGGGRLPGHCSHQTGQDVDLRLVLRDPDRGYVAATPRTLDVERTWALVLLLAQSCDVEMMFLDRALQRALYHYGRRLGVTRKTLGYLLQYPYRRASGLLRHRAHHRNHLHVRVRYRRVPLDLYGARALCGLYPEPAPPGAAPVQRLLRALRWRLARRRGPAAGGGHEPGPGWLRAPLP